MSQVFDFQAPYKWSNVYENLGQGKGLPPPSEIEFPN